MILNNDGAVQSWDNETIEEAQHVNFYLISDTHFNHQKLETYCMRPENFTDLIVKRWSETVKPEDVVIHLGDVAIGRKPLAVEILRSLPGRKWLIRGNHDRDKSCGWWVENGFDAACDQMVFRHCLLTHEPANAVIRAGGFLPYEPSAYDGLPEGCELNIHGHLHNIWDGFHSPERLERDKELLGIDPTKQLKHKWQRLFAVEYTDYRPVEFNKFVGNPDRYKARGPNAG